MAVTTKEGTDMTRRKRFTIRLVALGFAVAALSAPTAQAIPDEGLNGLQPIEVVSMRTADDVRHPSSVASQAASLKTADDVAHPSLVASPPTVASGDDGFSISTLGISGIVLLLGGGAAFMAVHQVRGRKMAHA
jgi:hypothetical protein